MPTKVPASLSEPCNATRTVRGATLELAGGPCVVGTAAAGSAGADGLSAGDDAPDAQATRSAAVSTHSSPTDTPARPMGPRPPTLGLRAPSRRAMGFSSPGPGHHPA